MEEGKIMLLLTPTRLLFRKSEEKAKPGNSLAFNHLFFLFFVIWIIHTVPAKKILVWHFNPDDHDFYVDPEANTGDSIDCTYWIKKSLDAGGYTYDYHNDLTLPLEIKDYDVIFATLGFYVC